MASGLATDMLPHGKRQTAGEGCTPPSLAWLARHELDAWPEGVRADGLLPTDADVAAELAWLDQAGVLSASTPGADGLSAGGLAYLTMTSPAACVPR